MANLKNLSERIKSVTSIQQVTKAMKMVAAAKVKKAQEKMEISRPYSKSTQDLICRILPQISVSDISLVEKRRKLLSYLRRKDNAKYQENSQRSPETSSYKFIPFLWRSSLVLSAHCQDGEKSVCVGSSLSFPRRRRGNSNIFHLWQFTCPVNNIVESCWKDCCPKPIGTFVRTCPSFRRRR